MLLGLAVILNQAYLDDHPSLPGPRADQQLVTPRLPTRPLATLQPTLAALVPLPWAPPTVRTPLPTAPPVAPVPTPLARPPVDLPTVPVRLRLVDKGGTQVLFDPAIGGLRQDPAVGTNVYEIDDVFVDPRDGREWTWVDGVTFVSPVGTLRLDAFRL